MKFKLNYFISLILLHAIAASNKITELQKIKGRVCLSLQSKKYQEEKEPMTNWIEHLSKELNIEPKQVLFLCLAMCYKLIPDDLARKIHGDLGEVKLDRNDHELMKIYDYEYYDYDNIQLMKTAYKEFQPIFDIIKDEVKMQGRNFFTEFKFEIPPLLIFFILYFIINTGIIFYKRIKNPPIINNLLNGQNNKGSNDNNINKENKNKDAKEVKEKIN